MVLLGKLEQHHDTVSLVISQSSGGRQREAVAFGEVQDGATSGAVNRVRREGVRAIGAGDDVS